MPIRFLTRLTKGAGPYHLFYVPRYVREFYNLRSGSYAGGVTLRDGSSANYRLQFTMNKNTLRGRVPESAGFSKSIVEVWLYPHTWKPFTTKSSSNNTILRERICQKGYVSAVALD